MNFSVDTYFCDGPSIALIIWGTKIVQNHTINLRIQLQNPIVLGVADTANLMVSHDEKRATAKLILIFWRTVNWTYFIDLLLFQKYGQFFSILFLLATLYTCANCFRVRPFRAGLDKEKLLNFSSKKARFKCGSTNYQWPFLSCEASAKDVSRRFKSVA